MFVKQVLETMGIMLELSIEATTNHLSQKTKHIDIRRHFVREFVQDGSLKTIYVLESPACLRSKVKG
jgi:hypothetical protein